MNVYTHYCRRFQDLKEYADELEAVFKSLLDIREVVKRKKTFLHVFAPLHQQKVNGSVKAVYKIHTNYGRIFRSLRKKFCEKLCTSLSYNMYTLALWHCNSSQY